jgi:hypothetical protein
MNIVITSQKKRLKLKVSSRVKHDLRGVHFAYNFAKQRAKQFGKTLNGATARIIRSGCGAYYGKAWQYRNVVKLAFPDKLPPILERYPRFSDMPSFWLWGGSESIVYLAAHEFGHLVYAGHGKVAERAVSYFGFEAVRAWRDEQYNHPACLI